MLGTEGRNWFSLEHRTVDRALPCIGTETNAKEKRYEFLIDHRSYTHSSDAQSSRLVKRNDRLVCG